MLPTASELSLSRKIIAILNGNAPLRRAFDGFADALSEKTVSWILGELNNLKREFLFFAWAMREKRLRSWDSHHFMIQSLACDQMFDSAWESLKELRDSDRVVVPQAFAVLISAYARSGLTEKAVEAFGRMHEFSSLPNTFTYNTMIRILIEEEIFELSLAVFNQMTKTDCRPNRSTFNILIDGLCKGARIGDALLLFDEMSDKGIIPDVMTYTIVLSGLCRAGRIDEAQLLLVRMEEKGCVPDSITYNSLLNGFCKIGRIDGGMELIKSFRRNGVSLGLNGYSCLIDGLFREGLFEKACKAYITSSCNSVAEFEIR